jgi:hypothetical protein
VDNQESMELVPLAIRMTGEAPTGVWYTQRPYGIGGEILFDPLQGLMYMDMNMAASVEILPQTAGLLGLSPSQAWFAYSDPANGLNGFMIRKLSSGKEIAFQSLPGSDRGSGVVVFSPGDTRLAWLEASGSLSEDNFHATLRVAGLDGVGSIDYPQESFYKTAGLGQAIWLAPLGWLDEKNLLLSVRSMGKDSQAVILNLEPQSGQLTNLAQGTFCAFLYP